MEWLIVFINGFIFDLLYGLYQKYMQVDRYKSAGIVSVLLSASGIYVGTLIYINKEFTILVPYWIGLFFGTYSIKYLRKYL